MPWIREADMIRTGKITIFFVIISFTCAIVLAMTTAPVAQEKPAASDILIVYSSGTPSITISDIPHENVDAITCPTPEKENMKTVSEKLGTALRERKLTVRVAEASDIKHPDEILRTGIVIIGSPSYFGNVSWVIKKFFDEHFGLIYASGEKRLGGKAVASFSMAEVEPSARGTLKAIDRAVRDCRGIIGPTMIILVKQPEEEINLKIKQFAEKIALEIQ